MKKSFHAFLIEQETEHTYKVMSVANIHDPEVMGRIGLAFAPYKLLEIEKDFFKPIRKENTEFPNHPDSACYCVKVIIATKVSPAVLVQAVCLLTKIRDQNLKVTGDAPEEEVKAEEKTEEKDAQADVGERRLGDFMRELEQARKEPEEVETPKIEENFTINHGALETVLGRAVRRGYYLVEGSWDNKAIISGPFKKAPVNYVFEEGLNPNMKLLSEGRRGDLLVFEFEVGAMEQPAPVAVESRKWEFEILDSDTGKTYPVVVTAPSETAARNKGIGNIAMRERLNPEVLTTTNPKRVG